MKIPADYAGPKLVVLEQNTKVDSAQQIFERSAAECSHDQLSAAATWLKDKPDSDLTKIALEAFKPKIDLKELADKFNMVKTAEE